jgi:hypothetical protein
MSGSVNGEDLSGRPDRIAFILAKPELQAQALHGLIATERAIAERLRQAYADDTPPSSPRCLRARRLDLDAGDGSLPW